MSRNLIPIDEIVRDEITQRGQEGCDVSGFEQRLANAETEGKKLKLYEQLSELKISGDFPYTEPTDEDEILALADSCDYSAQIFDDDVKDRIYAAWLGRTIGCIIGKPLERSPFVGGNGELSGWECIRRWQEGAGDKFPPEDYIKWRSDAKTDDMEVYCPLSCKENVQFAESDDDIRYVVIALLLGEKLGNDFTPQDVADCWHEYLSISMCYTAEFQAYLNTLVCGIDDPKERLEYWHGHLNPYREWIGAQIRVDHYAYVNPGKPSAAARAAYNDAIISHTKNGVYSAMFIAAMISAAFTEKDVLKCIEIGLSVVPKASRLYEAVRFAVELAQREQDITVIYRELNKKFGFYHNVHAINNTACVVAAIVYGGGDFVRSVAAAIGCGWDTDCNGATVGSFMGALLGAQGIPEYLSKPLNNTLYSQIPAFHPISITECAERSFKVYKKIYG